MGTVREGNVQQKIIADVIAERKRQDEKWGEQNHDLFVWASIIGEEYGEMCKAINEHGFDPTTGTEKNIYTEAIQVMASCMAMLECIDRLSANDPGKDNPYELRLTCPRCGESIYAASGNEWTCAVCGLLLMPR